MVRIITDSAADFEPGQLAGLDIGCIPLGVTIADKFYEENVNLDKQGFYDIIMSTDAMPQTSQPAPHHLIAAIAAARAAGDELIYVTLSSALSGSYQMAAVTAEDEGYEGAHVFDSLNATAGQQILVRYAAKLRDEGRTAREIIEKLSELRGRIRVHACIDTLEYLYKGGRISHTAYALGSIAQIKPIITVTKDGRIDVPSKVMGMKKGLEMLCTQLEETAIDEEFPVYVIYTSTPAPADKLAQMLTGLGRPTNSGSYIRLSACIGSHIGPNGCGLAYVERQ